MFRRLLVAVLVVLLVLPSCGDDAPVGSNPATTIAPLTTTAPPAPIAQPVETLVGVTGDDPLTLMILAHIDAALRTAYLIVEEPSEAEYPAYRDQVDLTIAAWSRFAALQEAATAVVAPIPPDIAPLGIRSLLGRRLQEPVPEGTASERWLITQEGSLREWLTEEVPQFVDLDGDGRWDSGADGAPVVQMRRRWEVGHEGWLRGTALQQFKLDANRVASILEDVRRTAPNYAEWQEREAASFKGRLVESSGLVADIALIGVSGPTVKAATRLPSVVRTGGAVLGTAWEAAGWFFKLTPGEPPQVVLNEGTGPIGWARSVHGESDYFVQLATLAVQPLNPSAWRTLVIDPFLAPDSGDASGSVLVLQEQACGISPLLQAPCTEMRYTAVPVEVFGDPIGAATVEDILRMLATLPGFLESLHPIESYLPAPVVPTGTYEGSFPFVVPGGGFEADVPFTAVVGEGGTLEVGFDWTGPYDYGSGIVATMTLGGSCSGVVDPDGVLSCSGAFVSTTEVQGMTFDNSGTFTTAGVVEGDLLEATITFAGALGSGTVAATAERLN